MPRHADKAITALHSTFSSNFQTELTDVESDESLSSGALVAPVLITKSRRPFNNQSPQLEIFESGFNVLPHHSKEIAIVSCTVRASRAGTPDLDANEIFMRRYATAMHQTVANNQRLGDTSNIMQALVVDTIADIQEGDTAVIWYRYAIDVEVWVHTT